MNRAILKKLRGGGGGGNEWRLLRKNLCSGGAPKAPTAAPSALPNNHESEKSKQNFIGKVKPYDIAIVGGGMVGMALACSLATMPLTKHLKVAIVDSNPALGGKLCIKKEDPPDPRVSAVTPATISFFKET